MIEIYMVEMERTTRADASEKFAHDLFGGSSADAGAKSGGGNNLSHKPRDVRERVSPPKGGRESGKRGGKRGGKSSKRVGIAPTPSQPPSPKPPGESPSMGMALTSAGRKIFDEFDEQRTGEITVEACGELIRRLGQELDPAEVRD